MYSATLLRVFSAATIMAQEWVGVWHEWVQKGGAGYSWVWEITGGYRWNFISNYRGRWAGESEGGGWLWKQASIFGPIGWEAAVPVGYGPGCGNAPKRRRLN